MAESGLTPCWGAEQAPGWSRPGQVKLLTDFPSYTVVRILLPMQETQVRSLGQEDPLEEEMATDSSILTWDIHMD